MRACGPQGGERLEEVVGVELLAPAKNLACGKAAIDHGADAVYIGAGSFGARAAAGNSVDDIRELCHYAHRFGARVFVTVNTIIYEQELPEAQRLICQLSEAGVDALLVQDMATLEMRRVAIGEVGHAPLLHASTQCDTRTAEKVRWLKGLGFSRAVLARETSIEEVRAIHEAVPGMELEVFVHGALCVSYSGQCYASQRLFGRSANRGECAQVCRMRFDLTDADGRTIVSDRHLLSLHDLCLIDQLEELAAAGATSFKIEGRLKDEDYVKNVVAAYSQRLDEIVARHPDRYRRASWGRSEHLFTPDLHKTFNRGYTTYFAHGRQRALSSPDTPKALGEFVGYVKELRRDSLNVAGTATFANGDGLSYIGDNHELGGFRVNRAVGNRLWPFKMPRDLKAGMALYRNSDAAFSRVLSGETARRVIPIDITLDATADGFSLRASFADGDSTIAATVGSTFDHQTAQKPQGENIRRQLSKLGGTAYEAAVITLGDGVDTLFIPSSILAAMRREAVETLDIEVQEYCVARQSVAATAQEESSTAQYWSREYKTHPYLFNISNHMARDFYTRHGLDTTVSAFEIEEPKDSILMQCRYCLRYELGHCVRNGGKKPSWREPLTLRLGDGRRFRLDFRCDECQMNVLAPRSEKISDK